MYQKILRLNPSVELLDKNKYWLSDFQAFNEQAPPEVRKLIVDAFTKKTN